MMGKMWIGLLVMFAAACGAARASSNEAHEHVSTICHDANVRDHLWNRNERSCHTQVDACLGGLTATQRASWDDQMERCLRSSSVYDCYASAPWC